jgi:ferredoxin-like protein FixX
MAKKLLIDLQKLREYKDTPVEGVLKFGEYAGSFKTIRELASFQFSCRRCEKAPCLEACPSMALTKNRDDIVRRATLLCVRCKSCIFVCPFGTLMDDLFVVKTSGRSFIRLHGEKDLQRFADSLPGEVASITDLEEEPARQVFSLSENILIKEFTWR